LVSGLVGTHDHIFVLSETFVFRSRASSSTVEGVCLLLVTASLLGVTRMGTYSLYGLHTHTRVRIRLLSGETAMDVDDFMHFMLFMVS
jgi:hypothetical protein